LSGDLVTRGVTAYRCGGHLAGGGGKGKRLVAGGAAAAAACTVLLALSVDRFAAAVLLRFLTGVCLAAVYPVGMKLMVSWVSSAGRGKSMGVLIGALTLGSTLPHLIAGIGSLPWRGVLLAAAAAGFVAALIALAFVRLGPHAGPAAPIRKPPLRRRWCGCTVSDPSAQTFPDLVHHRR
jgi:MFS family permease